MQLRSSITSDLSAIFNLRMALFEETGERMSPAERAEVLQATKVFFIHANNEHKTWVVEMEEEIVGVGTLAFFLRPPYPGNLAGKEAYLLNMYTKPEYRGRGIAKAILNEALAYAREAGFGKVWLHATDAGRPLYAAAGFLPAANCMELIPLRS